MKVYYSHVGLRQCHTAGFGSSSWPEAIGEAQQA